MKTIFSLILLVFAFVTHAAIINIPDDFPTIQEGVDAADEGDTVLVQPGTYFESITVENENLTISSLVLTTWDTTYVNETIIEGAPDIGGAFEFYADSRLVGFTIQNFNTEHYVIDCYATTTLEYLVVQDNYETFHGGVFCSGDFSLTINNTIIRNTEGHGYGGGVTAKDGAQLSIRNSLIENNSTLFGGGIYVYESPFFYGENLIVRGNSANSHSGIRLSHTDNAVLKNSLVAGNSDIYNDAGPVGIDRGNFSFINVTICDNSVDDEFSGGGVHVGYNSTFTILNSIIAFNSPFEIFEHHHGNCSYFITYSNIYNGLNNIDVIEDSLHWLVGNIEDDPLFTDPENGDYSLSLNSPCIDAGIAFYVSGEDTLINLSEDEYIGNAPDMGYIESHAPFAPLPFNLVSPPDFTPIDSANITLIWEASIDPDSLQDSVRYEVYLAHNPNDVYDNLIAVASDTTYDIQVDPESIYRWTIKAIDNDGYYRWANEMWTFTTSAINDVNEDLDLNVPKNYSIDSTWPNPFNSTTEVRIALPEPSDFTLSVYNLLGQNVALLADDFYTRGYHNFIFDANNLSSGIYFIQASVPGRFNQVNKVVLMK